MSNRDLTILRSVQALGPQSALRSQEPILICLLGPFQILQVKEPRPVRCGKKAEALLSYLALDTGQPVSRETLLEALWPDSQPELAGQSLNTLVYGLHRLLGPIIGGEPPIVHDDGYYRLNRQAGVLTDLVCFDALARDADDEMRRGNAGAAAGQYSAAADLYRGDLCLQGNVAAVLQREHVRARYLTILAHLADHHFAAGSYASCLDSVSRLLARDPCREDAHRFVMRCHVRLGERAQALRQYRMCEDILRTEFGAAPERATVALFEQIRTRPDSI